MYIKSIKAQGFKSFADKMEFDLNNGINAIVGPNGSGKSNVVDAILWVLGEQSVKSLRGDSQMSDVIFSGSKTREELKKASVAILFDNSDHVLNTEFNDVEIKRVIYRSGENEYYINNVKVRLKDITDLLMDVTSKFNIISQGNITALVENKSSERRVLFESAAGVLKYKKRKEEALRKLDGTNENLSRINLIIKELLTTLTPLEAQKDAAEKYLKIKDELQNVEISLIASDISNYTNKYNKLKNENVLLQKEADLANVIQDDKLEKLKLENLKNDEEIKQCNDKIISLVEKINLANNQKELNLERVKFNIDKKTIDENLLSLNENQLKYTNEIDVLSEQIEKNKTDLRDKVNEYNDKSDEEIRTKVKLSNYNNDYNKCNRDIFELQNKINIEKTNIENNAFLPRSVSSIISNPRLKGIHNTIGNIITINESHLIAINTALGLASNFIIVDNMKAAKEAINHLKDNNLGRATFFPIDTIESRHINKEIEYTISSLPGFIGIASDLVENSPKYQGIIENQLGNVIVVDNMDDLFNIAKELNFKYKMVTLEGEIIYPGGSISGGNNNQTKHDKSLLNKLLSSLEEKKTLLDTINLSIKNENSKLEMLQENLNNISKIITKYKYDIEINENELNNLKQKLAKINEDIKSLNDLSDNKLDNTIQEIIENIASLTHEKDLLQEQLKTLQSNKFDLNNNISSLEKEIQKSGANYRELITHINTNEIEIGKYEVKIDNLLNILSQDYNLSFEYANTNYNLDIPIDTARNMVSRLKSDLKSLGNVNTGSISEYDRLKKRYDFLNKQKEDLETSSSELIKIIDEMDEIMKDKFKKSFDLIAAEFTKVFRQMFKGGNGLLKLSDENDLLNTGINILAVPPGKKLNSTAALSGGEKSLTAICLIFAILNVKPAPFIVLDEAEAALDEENVNMFGDYLNTMKNQSQFILITHKKKMMEYADLLYGITMQESGVSKLVSVKLEDNE